MARDGYAVLAERLDRSRVDALAQLYSGAVDEVGRDRSGSFMPSMMITRTDVRRRLWDGVRELLAPVFDPMFVDGRTEVIGGSFVSKPDSPGSERNPHQDPSVFDERDLVSLSMWIPLTDSHVGNGTLWILPGSHRMDNHVRPPDVDSVDAQVAAATLASAVPIEMEAGQVLVIDAAVVHHSPPNESGAERVAAICALRSAGAPMVYARSESGAGAGVARIHDVGVEMYRSGNLVEPDLSMAPVIAELPYRPADMDDLRRSLHASGRVLGPGSDVTPTG